MFEYHCPGCGATARHMTVVTAALLALLWGSADLAAAARPGISWPAAPTGYSEGDAPMLLAPDLSVTDSDSGALTSASIRIRGRGQSGERLRFEDQSGIRGRPWSPIDVGDPPAALKLRGRASVEDYETALRSVWYQHNGDNPSRSRVVEIRVRDEEGELSTKMTRTLPIIPVNDAPRLGPGTQRFPFKAGDLPVGARVAVLDPDSRISGATVQITSNFAPEQDELGFREEFTIPPYGITGTYNSGTGVLTLTGKATAARYQTVLRAVVYRNSSTKPSGGDRIITFQVTDSRGVPSNVTNFDITFPRG